MGQADATATTRVFLVEDSPLVRERLETMVVEVTGAPAIGTAAGAEQAVQAILALRPDVVVLDVRLASGNGFEVLRALRAQAPEIDVYMLTNFAFEPYRSRAAALGARGFYDKTTEFNRVRDALATRAPAPSH